MTDSKKTEPVDNFPYLVYTDEADRTYDGNGGGSGAGSIIIDSTINDDETITLEITTSELVELLDNGAICFTKCIYPDGEDDTITICGMIAGYQYMTATSEWTFTAIPFGNPFISESLSDKPTA